MSLKDQPSSGPDDIKKRGRVTPGGRGEIENVIFSTRLWGVILINLALNLQGPLNRLIA